MSESGQFTPELAERIDRSRAATRRIAGIVRQLLDTGRGPSSSPRVASAFSVAPIVEGAIVAASVTAPDLDVEVVIADGLCARGEPSAVEQVLINLLVNAAHATRDVPGGGRVRVEGRREGERVQLRVSDNGADIPAVIRDGCSSRSRRPSRSDRAPAWASPSRAAS